MRFYSVVMAAFLAAGAVSHSGQGVYFFVVAVAWFLGWLSSKPKSR